VRDGEELVSELGGVGGSSCFQVGGEATRHVRGRRCVKSHENHSLLLCVYSPE
jgi:hypothetical protein